MRQFRNSRSVVNSVHWYSKWIGIQQELTFYLGDFTDAMR